MRHGVDVSVWQSNINWDTLATKAQFAFIRACAGTWIDRLFARNWAESRRVGIPRGAYVYYYASVDGLQQVDTMLQQCNGDYGELPMVVDLEDTYASKPWAPAQILDLQQALQHTKQTTGKQPMIYTGAWYIPTWLPHQDWLAEYPLWIAAYPQVFDASKPPVIPAPWKSFAYWQYSSTGVGTSYGCVSGAIDLDVEI